MIWKTRIETKIGQTRERTIFALIPRKCTDGYTRWLCNVNILEKYQEGVTGDIMCPEYILEWSEIEARPV